MDRKLADVDRVLLEALKEAERGRNQVSARGGASLAHDHLSRCIAEIEAARRALTSSTARTSWRDRRF
jgi:hypothetical protein